MGVTAEVAKNGYRTSTTGYEVTWEAWHDKQGDVPDIGDAINQVLTNKPSSFKGLPFLRVASASEKNSSAKLFVIKLSYGYDAAVGQITTPNSTKDQFFSGGVTEATYQQRFSGSAQGAKINHSLATIHGIDVLGSSVGSLFNNLINVNREGGKTKVNGLELNPPAPNVFSEFSFVGGTVIASAVKSLEAQLGTVNDAAYTIDGITYAAGELLFTSFDFNREFRKDDSTGVITPSHYMSLGWNFTPNETNIQIGDFITMIIPNKKGHEYLWVYSSTVVQNGITVMAPEYAFVEQVWPTSNYASWLGGNI